MKTCPKCGEDADFTFDVWNDEVEVFINVTCKSCDKVIAFTNISWDNFVDVEDDEDDETP